jgi:D-beta-D-heptose 7-phosphate kinase/D-beta-D-heptose 1-phosphate adenosyltransferase
VIRDKIADRESLPARVAAERAAGRRIIFTNGCFDILHAGHVLLLERARSFGDFLVVGLNSDRSVRGLGKGPDRPVNPQEERAVVLAALASVDLVCPFDEPTPLELIRLVAPDVLVKGEDWRGKGVVGREVVEARGGRVELVPLVGELSTTAVIQKLRDGNRRETEP